MFLYFYLAVHGIELSLAEKLLTDAEYFLSSCLALTAMTYDFLPQGHREAVDLPAVLRCLIVCLGPCGC